MLLEKASRPVRNLPVPRWAFFKFTACCVPVRPCSWDPTPLWDSHTDTVWLFFNGPAREGGDCAAYLCSTWASHSTDKGLSWQTRNVSTECKAPRFL